MSRRPPRILSTLRPRRSTPLSHHLPPHLKLSTQANNTPPKQPPKEDFPRQAYVRGLAIRACEFSSGRSWVLDVKARVGRCVISGLDEEGGQLAAVLLGELGTQWRRLLLAKDGYLTGEGRGIKRQAVQWGEMDSMKHVNNVMYNRFSETGRIRWIMDFARLIDPAHEKEWSQLLTPSGSGLILRSLYTQFKFPLTWPDNISVYHKLAAQPRAGDTNFVLEVVILSEKHQRVAARCVEDIVLYDYAAAEKKLLELFMLDMFKETFRKQEEEKEWADSRYKKIEKVVRHLEYMSWDEEGWKEYSGTGEYRVSKDPLQQELRQATRDLLELVRKSDTGVLRPLPEGPELLLREDPNREPQGGM